LQDLYQRTADPIAANTYRAAAQQVQLIIHHVHIFICLQAFWLMRDEEEREAEQQRYTAAAQLAAHDPNPNVVVNMHQRQVIALQSLI